MYSSYCIWMGERASHNDPQGEELYRHVHGQYADMTEVLWKEWHLRSVILLR